VHPWPKKRCEVRISSQGHCENKATLTNVKGFCVFVMWEKDLDFIDASHSTSWTPKRNRLSISGESSKSKESSSRRFQSSQVHSTESSPGRFDSCSGQSSPVDSRPDQSSPAKSSRVQVSRVPSRSVESSKVESCSGQSSHVPSRQIQSCRGESSSMSSQVSSESSRVE
jgi:hypothetical protein